MVNKEIWKDIEGFEGLYQVSNLGRIKSLPKKRLNCKLPETIIMKPKNTRRYFQVTLIKDKNRKQCLVHRLVAQAFIPNPENKPQVNHIDGNGFNNKVDNLEWCTAQENSSHAWKTGLSKTTTKQLEHFYKIKIDNSKRVVQMDLNGNVIKIWKSASDAARTIKGNVSRICNCCRGGQKTSSGYIWKYLK